MMRSRTVHQGEDDPGGLIAPGQATKDHRNIILIVEDEPLVRMAISDALVQAGYQILAASNGADALEIIAKHPDIFAVVSDIAMPGTVDGFELAQEVQRRRPHVGLILVSGQMEPLKSHFPRAAFFLPKPFKASTLLRLLRDMMESQALQKHGLTSPAFRTTPPAHGPLFGGIDARQHKVIELIGTSTDSWEHAAKSVVEEASKHLRDLRVAEVAEQDLVIEDGKVTAYRTKLKVSFKYHGEQ
jgi:flavin-binding protein dodecin/CheY-like chemotaxis protein